MIYPVLLCAFASLSTGIGGVIVALMGKISDRTMAFFQGFAAGVMVTVSFAEMFVRCWENMLEYMSEGCAVAAVVLLFAAGWFAGKSISLGADCIFGSSEEYTRDVRITLVTTAVMVLHNLPEGMLTIFSGMQDVRFGLEMAVAVALHNIPEGVVVASGVLYLTSSRKKAVGQSFFAGVSEFAGGLAAAVILKGVASSFAVGCVLALVGGIMVQTSVCELVPASLRLSGVKSTACGFMVGAAVIYISLYAI